MVKRKTRKTRKTRKIKKRGGQVTQSQENDVTEKVKSVWKKKQGTMTRKYTKTDDDLRKNKDNLLIHLLAKEKKIRYIPKLKNVNTKKRQITYERIGIPLSEKYHEEKGGKNKRIKRYNKTIRKMHRRFYRDTGFYHNDISHDSVLIDKNNKLFLIGFNYIGKTFTDSDVDKIMMEQ